MTGPQSAVRGQPGLCLLMGEAAEFWVRPADKHAPFPRSRLAVGLTTGRLAAVAHFICGYCWMGLTFESGNG